MMPTKRRALVFKWAVENYKTWPAPGYIPPDGPDPSEIGAQWLAGETDRHLPVLADMHSDVVLMDSTDWFYNMKRKP